MSAKEKKPRKLRGMLLFYAVVAARVLSFRVSFRMCTQSLLCHHVLLCACGFIQDELELVIGAVLAA